MRKTKQLLYAFPISLIIGLGSSCNREESKNELTEKNIETTFLQRPTIPNIEGAIEIKNKQYYSNGGNENTKFDLFIPEANPEIEKPLVIFVHGGGFTSGHKNDYYTENGKAKIKQLIDNGIAFANVNYRLEKDFSDDGDAGREDILASMNDVKRCLQFIRYNFDLYRINKTKIGMYGASAGGGCTIWLGLSNDMKIIDDPDPVYRESTRLYTIGHMTSQASYSPNSFYNVFPDNLDCSVLNQNQCADCNASDPPKVCGTFPGTIDEYPELDFLSFMSSDDPEMYISNDHELGTDECTVCIDYVHSPFHAKALRKRANQVGIQNKSYIPAFGIDTTNGQTVIDYMISKLLTP